MHGDKECFKCGQTKTIGEFYAHPRMADGHLNKCKECVKHDVRVNRERRWMQYAEYERKRAKKPERKEAAKRYQARMRVRNQDKYHARNLVASAVKCGRLAKKPCESCGAVEAEAHHEDYSKPLDVTWLCFRCHRAAHGQRTMAERT